MILKSYPWRNWRTVAVVLGECFHALLCAILLWIGFILLMPGSTFATSPAWSIAAAAASEEVWGARYLFAASVGLSAFFTRRVWWRMISTWIVASAHLATAIILVIGQPLNTGTGVYAIIACAGYGLIGLMAWDITR